MVFAPRHNSHPMHKTFSLVDVDRLDTWTRWRAGQCASCTANCCTMPLEVRLPDLVRLGLVDAFEAEHEEPRLIARRLLKARVQRVQVEEMAIDDESAPGFHRRETV